MCGADADCLAKIPISLDLSQPLRFRQRPTLYTWPQWTQIGVSSLAFAFMLQALALAATQSPFNGIPFVRKPHQICYATTQLAHSNQ
jgi:hypothetical protein